MTITERQQTDAVARQVSVKAIRQRRQKIAVEIAIILVLAAAVWVTEDRLSLFDQITAASATILDEVIVTVAFLGLASAVFSYRRLQEAQVESRARQRVESSLRVLQSELESRVQDRTSELYKTNEALQAKVAEHKRATEALGQSEEFNRRLVDASPIGIIFLDLDTRITYENPAMGRIMGVPENVRSPAIGQKLLDLPPVLKALNGATAQAIPSGEVVRGTIVKYQSLMGRESDLEIYSAPLQAVAGQLDGTILLVADVTTRAMAQADLKQRLAELEAISRITTALRTAQTVDEMLPLLIDETLSTLGGSAGGIWLCDSNRENIRLACQRGWGEVAPDPLKRGEGIPGQVITSGQPYLTREMRLDPQMPAARRALIPAGMGGVCVPIRAAEEVIGAMYVNAALPREFTTADAHLLTSLAEIAGNAIHRATLHEQTERQLQRIAALRAIDQAITASLDVRQTLSVFLEQVTTQLRVDAADVLLLAAKDQTLNFAAGRGFHTPNLEQVRPHVGEGRAGRVLSERRIVASDLQAEQSTSTRTGLLDSDHFVSYYGVPLIAKGQPLGVLEVFHRSRLEPNPEWISFLEALAGQAAIAIDNASLFDSLQDSNIQLAQAYDATIEGWSRALDLRDKETEGHSQRVTDLSGRLARNMGLNDADAVHWRRGALLHDIGKMAVPDAILLKPGPLTDDEWVVMRQHPAFAYQLLYPIQYLRPALDIPYCHHEKWDGSGYPRGLKADQIPLAARIFAIVDVWDALRSDRPYRPAWPVEKVREHIRQQSGKHFDPAVVAAFLQMDLEGER